MELFCISSGFKILEIKEKVQFVTKGYNLAS